MRVKAAVLYQTGKPMVVEDVELDGPGENEVLVKLVGTGVCHTDLGAQEGGQLLPMVLGHEGAGILQEVGRGVTSHRPGDRVVLTAAASCGRCSTCRRGLAAMCETYRPFYFNGYLPGGHTRLRDLTGGPVYHFFMQSSFAEYAVVPADCAVRVREDAPLETVGILGCGVKTGLGAVVNKLRPEAGSSIAVFGCGGVGMGSIMAARLCGLGKVIAVDILDSKLEAAAELGATHYINPLRQDVVATIRELTGGGVDYSIMAVGDASVVSQAFDCLRYGGTCVVVGAPPGGGKVAVDLLSLIREKRLTGSSMGSGVSVLDIPVWVDLFMQGRLPLDRLVSRRYPLEKINEAFKALAAGEIIKPVIIFG
ncbi:MAG: NAD(P)-dependent alcohol dehydrogenase [Dehalococcoidia bacterium]|nr:NAD(P)-dependent alcohol dehydrogenase [Dehalococcoidia bacterium]